MTQEVDAAPDWWRVLVTGMALAFAVTFALVRFDLPGWFRVSGALASLAAFAGAALWTLRGLARGSLVSSISTTILTRTAGFVLLAAACLVPVAWLVVGLGWFVLAMRGGPY